MAARATPQAQGWFKEQRHHREEGERQLIAGNFLQAETLLMQAAQDAEQHRYPGKRHGRILLQLATAKWKLQKTAEARQTVEAATVLLKQADSQPSSELSGCLDLLGALALEDGDSASALAHFGEALRLEEKLQPQHPETLCERCCHLAETHKRLGDLGPARSLLERALQIVETGLGPKHPATATQLIVLGVFFQEIKDFPESLPLLERALAIHKKTHGGDSHEVAQDYQYLADACHAAGDLERAVDFYQKALYLRERQLGGSSAELAALMVNLAGIYSSWGRYAPAVELLQQAVGKFALTPDRRMANTLESLSDIYNRSGRYSEAANCLTRARGVWEMNPDEHAAEIQQNAGKVAEIMEYLRPDELDALRTQVAGGRGRLGDLPAMTESERTEHQDRVGPAEHLSELPFGLSAPAPASQPAVLGFVPEPEEPQPQQPPFQFSVVSPDGRPLASPGQLPNLAPMHLTFVAPENYALQHQPPPTVPPQRPAMSFSHAELGEDKIATTVTVPAACGLLRLEPMQTAPYAVFPQQPEILPFRRHGIRLRRGSRSVAGPEGLPSRELKKLEMLDPLNAPPQQLSSAAPAAFSAAQMNVPVRKVSAARVELDDERRQYTLPVKNWDEFDCTGAPSLEALFQEFTTLPTAFIFDARPMTLPDALKLQAQPIPPPPPQFALPAPLPLAALADLSDLSFDFLVLKY